MKLDKDNYLFAVLLVILIIVVSLFIYSLLIGRTPEQFTQVWLGNNLSTVNANENFDVNFFIDNREEEAVTYTYKIIAEGSTKAEGGITIGPGKTENLAEEISLNNPSSEKQKVLIEITKPDKPEPYTLWFWVKVEEAIE